MCFVTIKIIFQKTNEVILKLYYLKESYLLQVSTMLGTPLTRGMKNLGFQLVLSNINHGELPGGGEVFRLMLGKETEGF